MLSRLPPARWVAEESLVYDQEGNELHRPSCVLVVGDVELEPVEALELVWAPRMGQECYPGVTLALGRGRSWTTAP
jgi:hypothetical protein